MKLTFIVNNGLISKYLAFEPFIVAYFEYTSTSVGSSPLLSLQFPHMPSRLLLKNLGMDITTLDVPSQLINIPQLGT